LERGAEGTSPLDRTAALDENSSIRRNLFNKKEFYRESMQDFSAKVLLFL
jgi:hypothetical protein